MVTRRGMKEGGLSGPPFFVYDKGGYPNKGKPRKTVPGVTSLEFYRKRYGLREFGALEG